MHMHDVHHTPLTRILKWLNTSPNFFLLLYSPRHCSDKTQMQNPDKVVSSSPYCNTGRMLEFCGASCCISEMIQVIMECQLGNHCYSVNSVLSINLWSVIHFLNFGNFSNGIAHSLAGRETLDNLPSFYDQ